MKGIAVTTKVLLYAFTLLFFEWLTLLAGIGANLILGVVNVRTDGKYLLSSKLGLALNTLPAIAVLFLVDWAWRVLAGCAIPFILLPVLAAIHVRYAFASGANGSNRGQALATAAGVLFFVPVYLLLHGVSGVTWTGFDPSSAGRIEFRGLGDCPAAFRAKYGAETGKNLPSRLDSRFSMDTYHAAEGYRYRVSYMGDSAELVAIMKASGDPMTDNEIMLFLEAFSDGRSWRETQGVPSSGKVWQRDDAILAKYSTGGNHFALEFMTTKTLKLFMVNE